VWPERSPGDGAGGCRWLPPSEGVAGGGVAGGIPKMRAGGVAGTLVWLERCGVAGDAGLLVVGG